MKRFLLVFVGLLAGCNIVFQPGPVTPNLRITEFDYTTNYRGSNTGRSYICDNRPTTLTYKFSYEGGIERWTSYLQGRTLGQIKGMQTFDPRSQGVSPYQDSGFKVSYVMDAYFAPYKTAEKNLSPQVIAVVPVPQPVIIGAANLHLTLEGTSGGTQSRTSADIPVIANCP